MAPARDRPVRLGTRHRHSCSPLRPCRRSPGRSRNPSGTRTAEPQRAWSGPPSRRKRRGTRTPTWNGACSWRVHVSCHREKPQLGPPSCASARSTRRTCTPARYASFGHRLILRGYSNARGRLRVDEFFDRPTVGLEAFGVIDAQTCVRGIQNGHRGFVLLREIERSVHRDRGCIARVGWNQYVSNRPPERLRSWVKHGVCRCARIARREAMDPSAANPSPPRARITCSGASFQPARPPAALRRGICAPRTSSRARITSSSGVA